MRRVSYLVTTLWLAAVPASAKPIDFSAVIEGHAGYAINPRLDNDRSQGAGSGSIRFAPLLTQETSLSRTTLGADIERAQYTNSYGHSQTVSATLDHSRSLSEHLRVDLNASYLRSNNLLLGNNFDSSLLGDIANSQRVWHAQAGGSVTWQMSARDELSGGVTYAHDVANSYALERSYDEYGANFTYLRTLSARTKVGVRMNASRYNTDVTGNSTSLSPAIVVQQVLSPIWKLDADVGVIIQRSGTPSSTTNGLGFHASLCGTYPRSTLCLTAGRDTSATAFSGVRRQLSVSASYTYRLTERSTVSAQASYLHDQAGDTALTQAFPLLAQSSTAVRGDIEYNRELTKRLSAGVEARGGYRKNLNGSGRSVSASGYVRFKIG